MPNLGLAGDLGVEFRVYVLRCAPRTSGSPYTWYCGVEHRSMLARRLRSHFDQTASAAHFCQVHKPLAVEVVWPVTSRAAEAYVFYALAEKLPACALAAGRLGGWTQTHSELNALGRVTLERARRMVTSSCLTCGKAGHFARDCSEEAPNNVAVYPCGHCGATLRITDHGLHETVAKRGAKRPRCDSPPRQDSSARSSAGAVVPAAPAAPRRQAFRRVLVCDHEYTSLQWFLGRKPAPREVAAAVHSCKANALELRGGDTKTLEAAGFARAPPRHKELLVGRTYPGALARESAENDSGPELRVLENYAGQFMRCSRCVPPKWCSPCGAVCVCNLWGATYAAQHSCASLCCVIHVVQSMRCNLCGPMYAVRFLVMQSVLCNRRVQSMQDNLCSAIYAVHSVSCSLCRAICVA